MPSGKRKEPGRKKLENEKQTSTLSLPQDVIETINNDLSANDHTVKYIDLFCGLGGIRIGFEQALNAFGYNGKCVFSSDTKPSAIKAYTAYFDENPKCDITKVDPSTIPDFDFLLAGFPCQSFSQAGLGLGFEDTRGTLFFNVAEILSVKKPSGFVLENVEGLVNHDHGKTFKVITDTLENLGYNVKYNVLNGKDFGLAQSRKRLYIIGLRNKPVKELTGFNHHRSSLEDIIDTETKPVDSVFTKKLLDHYPMDQLYGKAIKDKRGGSNNIHSWDIELKGEVSEKQKELLGQLLKQRRNKKWAAIIGIQWMDGMPLTEKMISTFYPDPSLHEMLIDLVNKGYLVFEYPKQFVNNRRVPDKKLEKGYNIVTGKLSFEFSKILNPHEVTPTLVATDVHKLGVPVDNGIRSLTVKEGLRLFGFPENYSLDFLKSSEAFDLLGNTVCVPVIRDVSKKLIESSIEG